MHPTDAPAISGKEIEDELQLLCVEIATHRFALPVDVIVEIHPAAELAALPDAPDVVRGLVNRRGSPLPVIDLRHRLGMPSRPLQVEDRLVVVQMPDHHLALLVDAAVDIITVPAAAIDEAVVRAASSVRASGVVVLPDSLVVVLDVMTFLSAAESTALAAALDHARRVSA